VNNCTHTEWTETLALLEASLSKALPTADLHRSGDSLNLSLGQFRYSVRLASAQLSMEPVAEVGLPALSDEAGRAALCLSVWTQCLALVSAQVMDLERRRRWPQLVWLDGECPCDHCGGRGTVTRQPCQTCGGKGVR
jgi:hypothetical protein